MDGKVWNELNRKTNNRTEFLIRRFVTFSTATMSVNNVAMGELLHLLSFITPLCRSWPILWMKLLQSFIFCWISVASYTSSQSADCFTLTTEANTWVLLVVILTNDSIRIHDTESYWMWDWGLDHRFQNGTPFDPILSQLNPVHIFHSNSLRSTSVLSPLDPILIQFNPVHIFHAISLRSAYLLSSFDPILSQFNPVHILHANSLRSFSVLSPFDPILSQLNPVHIFHVNSLNIHFIIIMGSYPGPF